MVEKTPEAKARQKALRYLTSRARSEEELRCLLEQKGFSHEVASYAVAEMYRYGYLDDERYAREFIESRRSRGYGPLRVRLELEARGIAGELISSLIDELFSREEDGVRIFTLLAQRQRRRTGRKEPLEKIWRRETDFLRRRGFAPDLIAQALQEWKDSLT